MKLYNIINIIDVDDRELEKISEQGLLSLSIEEMRAIKEYFKRQNRNPTDCELETIAQTWSEHCKHKTLTAEVELKIKKGKKFIVKKYKNVLKETIFYSTKKINHKDCLSVFEDNAGIVRFNESYAVAFKVETHNHPSALEPYGGAATGVGGVIRDIIGCGLAAKPVANTDVFCFGELSYDKKLPKGVFHPKRIFLGVVCGVRDYGNRMGIPTVNGTVVFDNKFLFNPLVYCGCVGIIPVDKVEKKVKKGQVIILVGGRTGRDGIHGATFSSAALHEQLPTSVVQIGDPVVEKMFLDVILKARDLNLYTAITDCGAGGLSSACGELTKDFGCRVYLEKVPLKYKDLNPWEIWLSESQERMVVITDKNKAEKFLSLCKEEDVEATIIGEVTDSRKLEVFYNNIKICELEMDFLHNGLPKKKFKLSYNFNKNNKTKKVEINQQIEKLVEKVFSSLNVCSKEWVIRQYDHEVQGNTILKPLVGNQNTGFYSPQDACVLYPFNIEGLETENKAISISCGIKPSLGEIDVEKMTEYVIDEAIRNLICVGTSLEKIFLLDNFCWGELNKKNLAELFLTCETAKNVALKYKTPFVSGKDSLNNYYIFKNKKISIPPTLLISALGIIDDLKNIKTSYFKSCNNYIFLLGQHSLGLGGSVLSKSLKLKNLKIPKFDINTSIKTYKFINNYNKYIKSAHDISDGGVITTVAEMCFTNRLGAEINVNVKDILDFLFSEPAGCIVVEVDKKDKEFFEKKLLSEKIPYLLLGIVNQQPYIVIKNKNKKLLDYSIEKIYNLWSKQIKI
ncbi:MAG: phosphoribosylformylglycinamidine synthase subunit PurL [Endomicrobiia bacterium]